jgi:transposase
VVDVEQWAELRREHFVGGKSIKELSRATGLSRNTLRRVLRSEQPPSYRRPPKARVIEPFKDEIHRLLREDPHPDQPAHRR